MKPTARRALAGVGATLAVSATWFGLGAAIGADNQTINQKAAQAVCEDVAAGRALMTPAPGSQAQYGRVVTCLMPSGETATVKPLGWAAYKDAFG